MGVREGKGVRQVYLTETWLTVCLCCGVESITADVTAGVCWKLQRLSPSRNLPPSLEWHLE